MAYKLSFRLSMAILFLACFAAPRLARAAQAATTITVTASPAALTAGTSETLTAAIAPAVAVSGYTITGTVKFYDQGTVLLGTATVSNNAATLTGVTLNSSQNHSITAVYSGDSNWLGSTSAALTLAATSVADYVVLTANYTTVPPGAALVLTATVTPASTPAAGGEQNPTGDVVFYNGTAVIGTVALEAAPVGDASIATFTSDSVPGGLDVLTAVYQGDLYFAAGTSNALSLDVQDFTIAPDAANPPTNVNIVQGAAGSAAFDIGGQGGFNNLVQVVCTVPSQDDMTCSASPQQVTPPAVVTFVVQTYSAGTGTARGGRHSIWPRAAGGAALALLGFFFLPWGWRARVFDGRWAGRIVVLILLLVGLGGAGAGCNGTSQLGPAGTPLGVATLKITASAYVDNAVVSHSVYLTVNVVAPGAGQ